MDLGSFEDLNIRHDNVVEYTVHDKDESRKTRLGYFLRLLIGPIPEPYGEGRPEPPFVEIAHWKNKNGVPQGTEDVPIKDIHHIASIGRSDIV